MHIIDKHLFWRPLDEVTVAAPPSARLRVLDGEGVAYHEGGPRFRVGGAMGTHNVLALDPEQRLLGSVAFRVEAATGLRDGRGVFGPMLDDLVETMRDSCRSDGGDSVRIGNKRYRFLICWLRDHTHTLKGMQYFDGDLRTGLELYADTQRADGMVYDRVRYRPDVQGWRDHTFRPGDFIRTLNPGTPHSATLQRIPVENDVEYLFLECLFRTWRATGDTAWMARYLDAAINAVTYATSDAYRWSSRFGLLRRGYTIDTWDYMHEQDGSLTSGPMVCDLAKTTFGVMHGDNTGMAAACRYLAELLRAADRADEAPRFEALADSLLERLSALAWNGGFYRHHVSEDPAFVRDVGGTDESAQVTLSNAYALGRGIGADKSRAILRTYQRIRAEMPAASPGEWYTCYPPFEKGFSKSSPPWQYVNGGVSAFVAGELAAGAFALGDAAYGIDILERLKGLADRHGGRLHVCFNGNPQTDAPHRAFASVPLGERAGVTAAWRESGGWGERGNDLSRLPAGRQVFDGIPFELDGRGLGLGTQRAGYSREQVLPVGQLCGSVYLLHTVSSPHPVVGQLEVRYADGASRVETIMVGRQLDGWFMPGSAEVLFSSHAKTDPKGWPAYRLAWRGANDTYENVGVFLWGWDNPRPDVAIDALVFRAAETGALWWVPGVTLCDRPVWFPQSDLSYGIPDAWGAAAVVVALLEGLAGVRDDSCALRRCTVTPQWRAGGETEAEVTVKYEASGAYVAYRWQRDATSERLLLACSGDATTVRLPVDPGTRLLAAQVDGRDAPCRVDGDNGLATFVLSGRGVHDIRLAVQ